MELRHEQVVLVEPAVVVAILAAVVLALEVIVPGRALLVPVRLAAVADDAGIAGLRGKAANFKEFTEIAGLPEIQQLEEKYGLPEDQRAGL